MPKQPPPLTFVRSFEASARHLSFTRAAEELGYTQAAISHHVRALEDHLGQPLFKRLPRSLRLTEAGQAFLPNLRRALHQIDAAAEAITTSSQRQSVTIACPLSLAQSWLSGLLAEFLQAYPAISVTLRGTLWDRAEEAPADLVISTERDDEVTGGSIKLWQESLALVAAPALAESLASPAAVAGKPAITVLGRFEYWVLMAEVLGIQPPDNETAIKTNASAIALEMAAAGSGLAVLPSSLSALLCERGLLRRPFAETAPCPWSYYLRDRTPAPRSAVSTLKAWILEKAEVRSA